MRDCFVLVGLAVGVLASTSSASIVVGGGGLIPASGTGGGAVWNSGNPISLPPSPFMSTVNIADGVSSVQSITFTNLVHTWMGDLQAVLFDPNGVGHNIFVRPGVGAGGSTVGASLDFNGTYAFFESGAPGNLPIVTGGGTAILPPGDYNQTFEGSPTALGSWVSGAQNIFNTPLSQISGGAGDWSLVIYDWVSGDIGSIGSWTLDYTPIPAPGAFALLGAAAFLGARRRRAN